MRKTCVILAMAMVLSASPVWSDMVDNNDGTVSDTTTGLMWQQDTALSAYNWENAIKYCEDLSWANKSDWRLPDLNELQSLVNYSQYGGFVLDSTVFYDIGHVAYWSSTSDASGSGGAWRVTSYDGGVYPVDKSYDGFYARCVRGGQ